MLRISEWGESPNLRNYFFRPRLIIIISRPGSGRLNFAGSPMNWKDEPATEMQISRLRQLGCMPERPLTKGEAAHLISHHDVTFVRQSNTPAATAHETSSGTYVQFDAYQLRVAVESARRTVFQAETTETKVEGALDSALERRQRFWMDTCCEPAQMHMRSAEVIELHMKLGCQYVELTWEQT